MAGERGLGKRLNTNLNMFNDDKESATGHPESSKEKRKKKMQLGIQGAVKRRETKVEWELKDRVVSTVGESGFD